MYNNPNGGVFNPARPVKLVSRYQRLDVVSAWLLPVKAGLKRSFGALERDRPIIKEK